VSFSFDQEYFISDTKQEIQLGTRRVSDQDAIQNQNYSKTKLTMPVLALAGGYIPTFGGNITMPSLVEYGMNQLAQNVTAITVPNSGHYIAEEQPDFLVKSLNDFFSGNSTTSSESYLFFSIDKILADV
jgi:pimeloyl-ACP methyl ester carboxylesterase